MEDDRIYQGPKKGGFMLHTPHVLVFDSMAFTRVAREQQVKHTFFFCECAIGCHSAMDILVKRPVQFERSCCIIEIVAVVKRNFALSFTSPTSFDGLMA